MLMMLCLVTGTALYADHTKSTAKR